MKSRSACWRRTPPHDPLHRPYRFALPLAVATLILLCANVPPARAVSSTDFVVQDMFGRTLNAQGITLVDWEGYLANPAIKLTLRPPSGASTFPITATLSANGDRLYFDLPSMVGGSGPTKSISLSGSSSAVSFFLSISPDRDSLEESYVLTITGGGGPATAIPIHVLDQDRATPNPFQANLNFTKDQTSFFTDSTKRNILGKDALDWDSFWADMALDSVAAHAEQTWIWNSNGFVSGSYTTNATSYLGFLLYVYGIHSSQLRSGGEGSSAGGYQTSGGVSLQLKRSGGEEIETAGNYDTLGWFLTSSDDDWWVSGNLGNEPNDLYSIAHHEMGHALAFNGAYPRWNTFKSLGFVQDSSVLAYHHSYPHIDASDHLSGEVDNLSRRGAFGNEYGGIMPRKRWLITKLDLLCMQAVGYKLKRTSPFIPVSITDSTLGSGVTTQAYTDTLRATGGVPGYNWTVTAGALPPGLNLNSFTGVVSGTPSSAGTYAFTARVQDNDSSSAGASANSSIQVLDVSAVGSRGLASSLRLYPASPNPFGSATRLAFRMSAAGEARLDLFDAAGRHVRTLAQGTFSAGSHEVTCPSAGLASGAYFCRFQAQGAVLTTRIVRLQ